MPGRDGTGPRSTGPMTGRRRDNCAAPGYTGATGRGVCCGYGRTGGQGGRGFRRMFHRTGSPGRMRCGYSADSAARDEEIGVIRSSADALRALLAKISARIEGLTKEAHQS
jgi:hypothetical protein